jgi:hypothetical protein
VFGYSGLESSPLLLTPEELLPGGYVQETKPEVEDVRWVEGLVQSINSYIGKSGKEALAEAHRKSYFAWHYRGRQVLRISKVRSGSEATFSVIAGVNYSRHVPDQLPPIAVTVSGHPPKELVDLLRAAAVMAVKNRREGRDIDNREHQLQESLSKKREHFGFRQMEREFPVLRPGGGRAYIDFLAQHEEGGLHVVETKIGTDTMLVLQGLDYWIWVKTNMDVLRERFELPISPEVKIDFVLGNEGQVSRYTNDQLLALKNEIPWRLHTIRRWESPETTEIDSLPPQTLPDDADA